MRLHVSTDIPLSEPTVDCGLITWFNIEILDDYDDDGKETNPKLVGHARVARIHASHAFDSGEPIWEALDADSGELEALYDVFFDEGWLKDEFYDGVGADIMYVSEIGIEPAYEDRNIDLAVVRRLCDTLGQGAALAVVPYTAPEEIRHWERLGFEMATPGVNEGYVCLRLANRTARVDDRDEHGHFKVLPNPSPEQEETHH
jgi:hypothetical protein